MKLDMRLGLFGSSGGVEETDVTMPHGMLAFIRTSRWWFHLFMCYVHPDPWGNYSISIVFFEWVGFFKWIEPSTIPH